MFATPKRVRPNSGLILKILRPNACCHSSPRHLKDFCKLGLRVSEWLKFGLRTKSDLFYQVTQYIYKPRDDPVTSDVIDVTSDWIITRLIKRHFDTMADEDVILASVSTIIAARKRRRKKTFYVIWGTVPRRRRTCTEPCKISRSLPIGCSVAEFTVSRQTEKEVTADIYPSHIRNWGKKIV